MNANPMGSLYFLALVVVSILAIVEAKGAKRKSLTVLTIVGFMAAGIGIGAGLGAWGGNMAIGGDAAAALMISLGLVGAVGCLRRNKKHNRIGSVAV